MAAAAGSFSVVGTAGADDLEAAAPSELRSVSRPAPAAPPRAPAQDPGAPPWTVFVYLAADNDLEAAAMIDMEEMAEAAGPGVRFVALIDRNPNDESAGAMYTSADVLGLGDFHDAKVVEITGDGVRVVEELGEVNSAHPQTLAWFLWYGLTNFRSERNAVVLWNHGVGPVKAIGVDESSTGPDGQSQILDVLDLQQAFQSAYAVTGTERVDLVVFDACLNGYVELARAMSPFARYYLASEQLVQGAGQDYTAFAALNGATMDGRDLGLTVMQAFPDHHHPLDPAAQELTLSLIDLDAVPRLDSALGSFARAVEADLATNGPALLQARAGAMEFPYPGYPAQLVDLGDLLSRLPAGLDPALLNARNAAYEALRAAVVDQVLGPSMEGATGLSVHLPTSGAALAPGYERLADPSGWSRMLQLLFFGEEMPSAAVEGGLELDVDAAGWKATLSADDLSSAAGAYATFGLSRPDGNTTLLTLLPAQLGAGGANNVQASWNYQYFGLDGAPVTASVQSTPDGAIVTVPGVYLGPGGVQRSAGLRFRAETSGGAITGVSEHALVSLDTAAAVIEYGPGDRFIPLLRVADGVDPVGEEQAPSVDLGTVAIGVGELSAGDQFDVAIALVNASGETTARTSSAARP